MPWQGDVCIGPVVAIHIAVYECILSILIKLRNVENSMLRLFFGRLKY